MGMPWKQPPTKTPAADAVRPKRAEQTREHCPYSFAAARTICTLLLALTLGACATATPPPEPTASQAPAVAAPVAAPAPPPGPTKRQLRAAAHREKAEALEREGALRRAVDEWEIALAIEPGDAAARQGREKVLARIEGAVAARITEARAALARGSIAEARRRL